MVFCSCLPGASFESALRKGDVALALSHLRDDPLTACRATFGKGNTIWHLAGNGGHVELLRAMLELLSAVWPPPPASPDEASSRGGGGVGGGTPFGRRSHPFQRLSDGLRGRVPDPSPHTLPHFVASPNVLGQTPLMSACTHGHAGAVQWLLDVGVSPWARDRGHCTALHYSTLHDHADCITAILGHPASARPPRSMRQTIVRLVDLPNATGYAPAHFAAAAAKQSALRALLAGGANIAVRCWQESVDWISGPRGSTPMHLAARRGDVDMCKMLLRHYLEVLRDSGAVDPRLHADARGVRPFHLALDRGSAALAEMLMPSTPLGLIFEGTDAAVRLYNVPRLKALAAAALQGALLAEITALEAEAEDRRRQVAEAGVAAARATAAAGGGGTASGAAGGLHGLLSGGSLAVPGEVGAGGLSRAPSIMASMSQALDGLRRQSLQSVRSIKQRLRRNSRAPGKAAAGGGGGGGEGGGAGDVGSAATSRMGPDALYHPGYTASVYSNSVYGQGQSLYGMGQSMYGVMGGSGYDSAYPGGAAGSVYGAASVMGGSAYGNVAYSGNNAVVAPMGYVASPDPNLRNAGGGAPARTVADAGLAAGLAAGAAGPTGLGGVEAVDAAMAAAAAAAAAAGTAAAGGDRSQGRSTGSRVDGDSGGTGGSGRRVLESGVAEAPQVPSGASPLRGASFEGEGRASPPPPAQPSLGVPPPWLTAPPRGGGGAAGAGGGAGAGAGLGLTFGGSPLLLPPLALGAPRQSQSSLSQLPPLQAPTGISPFAMPAVQLQHQQHTQHQHSGVRSRGSAGSPVHGGGGSVEASATPTGALAAMAAAGGPAAAARQAGTALQHPQHLQSSQPGGSSPIAYRSSGGGGGALLGAVGSGGGAAAGAALGAPVGMGLHPVDEGGPGDEAEAAVGSYSRAAAGRGYLDVRTEPALPALPPLPPLATAVRAPSGPPSANVAVVDAAGLPSAAGMRRSNTGAGGGGGGGGIGAIFSTDLVGGSPVFAGSPTGGSPRSLRVSYPGMGTGAGAGAGAGAGTGLAGTASGLHSAHSGRMEHTGAAAAGGGGGGAGGGAGNLLTSILSAFGGGGGGGGGGGSPVASRRGSGRLQRQGSNPTSATGGGAVAAGGVIGSDTSEDYCGICFERPVLIFIKPCQHYLCAECSREVTRMVETQAPQCPYCRGVVRGFGC